MNARMIPTGDKNRDLHQSAYESIIPDEAGYRFL